MSELPRLSANRDYVLPDMDTEAQRLREEGRRSGKLRSGPAAPSNGQAASRASNPLSMSSLVFALLFLAVGVSVYLLWRQNEVKTDFLAQHNQRLVFLERGLNVTSETFTDVQRQTDTNVSDVSDSTRKNGAEIDKLWVAWRKNQSAIKERRESSKKTGQQLIAAKQQIAGAALELERLQERLVALQDRMQKLGRADNTLEETLSEALVSVSGLQRQLSSVATEQKKARRRFAQLSQWQKSVDNYRRDVNSRLDELRGRLVAR